MPRNRFLLFLLISFSYFSLFFPSILYTKSIINLSKIEQILYHIYYYDYDDDDYYYY